MCPYTQLRRLSPPSSPQMAAIVAADFPNAAAFVVPPKPPFDMVLAQQQQQLLLDRVPFVYNDFAYFITDGETRYQQVVRDAPRSRSAAWHMENLVFSPVLLETLLEGHSFFGGLVTYSGTHVTCAVHGNESDLSDLRVTFKLPFKLIIPTWRGGEGEVMEMQYHAYVKQVLPTEQPMTPCITYAGLKWTLNTRPILDADGTQKMLGSVSGLWRTDFEGEFEALPFDFDRDDIGSFVQPDLP